MLPSSKRVLHVEDNPGDARLAEIALSGSPMHRYDLRQVDSLALALDSLRAERFDAVLLDLNLPDSDDLDTLGQVVGAAPTVPVIVLSGRNDAMTLGRAVEAGAQDFVLKDEVVSAIGDGRLPRVVDYAITRNDEKLRLSNIAFYDEVTGLPTRRLLRDRWTGALARARREQAWLGVLVVDLDNFKDINDRLGHAMGDEVLRAAGVCLVSAVRQNDTVARVGGDEFVVLLETIRGLKDARDVAGKLRQKLRKAGLASQSDIVIEASIGVSVGLPEQSGDLQDLVERADLDMYREKKCKKNVSSAS